jgi:hypothetical protein
MKTIALVVLGSMLQACGAQYENDLTQVGNPQPVEDQAVVQVKGNGPKQGSGDTCEADAQFDFHVWGDGLSTWEGRRVVAAAIENEWGSQGIDGNRRPVLLSGAIQNGAFSLFCPRSLKDNYAYPSWAVFIDVDGDGHCSTSDVGYQMQLYGWNAEVNEEIPATAWVTIPTGVVYGRMGRPLGSTASDFCAGYFNF